MHLDANVRYSMLDIMLEERRSIARLENSRILNSKMLPKNMSVMIESMKGQKEQVLKDMQKMFSLEVKHPVEDLTILELFISPDYFMLGEILNAQFGRVGRKLIKVIDQQTIINKLEKDLKQVYQKKFEGTVIEDDGKRLIVNR